jgi:hypothetical protein
VKTSHFGQDIVIDARVALRSLQRSRGLAALIVVTLSVAVATISGLFSVVNAFYKPIPYPNAERIVFIAKASKVREDVFRRLVDLGSFEHIGGYASTIQGLLVGTEARRVRVAVVDSGFFAVLKPATAAGRLPTASEMARGDGIIVLSYRLAQAVFGTADAAIGKSVRIDGALWRVTSVLAPAYTHPDRTEAWISNAASGPQETLVFAIGLLKPGATFDRASAAVNMLRRQLRS